MGQPSKLTAAQRAKAEAHGIPSSVAHARMLSLGWSAEDAVTRPIQPRHRLTDAEIERLARNDLDRRLFIERLANGWDRERALSFPRGTVLKTGMEYKGQIDTLKGHVERHSVVPYETVYRRVRMAGWSLEKALTTPPRSRQPNTRKPPAPDAPKKPDLKSAWLSGQRLAPKADSEKSE